VLYIVQCILGAVIHFVKRRGATRRPPQNYLHAILGLSLIGIAMYQVHLGYNREWEMSTGREPLPKGVDILFYVWVAVSTL
jgi:hypothetical protein